jgi:hypothetical protein
MYISLIPAFVKADVSVTKADEVQIQTALREVMRTATPYNNLSELPRKLPKDFFENVEAGKLVQWVEDGFKKTPPGQNEDIRSLLFTGLDVAAIVTRQQQFAPLLRLRSQSTRNVYRLLREENATNGLVLYKLYNEGTILRSPNICIGVDIVLEEENRDLASGFAALLDGLLVTHRDGDHYDYASPLYAEFEKKGKPVIVPSENQSVPFGGKLTDGQIGSVKWTAFRGGHLDLRFSAFYLLQINDRWRVLHSGDNTVWMDFAKSEYAKNIDIFLLKPESTYAREGRPRGDSQEAMKETLNSIRPHLVIPHHLLELGHGLNAYGHDMGIRLYKQAPIGVKVLMLQWGETVTIP